MKQFTTLEIAKLTNSELKGDPELKISNAAELETAEPSDISFLSNPRYEGAMKKSRAGAIFIAPSSLIQGDKTYLLNPEPSRAFQTIAELFNPHSGILTGFKGIHPTAIIHPTAKIGENVEIGPYSVIDEGVEIEANTKILTHVSIGPYSYIGSNTLIHSHVTVREGTKIGSRVTLQPGAVIGSCGFGYTQDKEGKHTKLNQIGIVVIEDDVEIGANTPIDRSRLKETRIGKGSKIDNLVQIGHGVQIGPDNLIISQTGIAGSSSTGKRVILAGQVAIAGHLHLDDDVVVAGKSGVTKSLTKGRYNGIPAVPLDEYNRNTVLLRNIAKIEARLKNLEKKTCKSEG